MTKLTPLLLIQHVLHHLPHVTIVQGDNRDVVIQGPEGSSCSPPPGMKLKWIRGDRARLRLGDGSKVPR